MLSNSLYDSMDGFPSLLISDGIIKKVSGKFAEITGYEEKELINLSIYEILKTLRIGPNFSMDSISNSSDYFLFTKSLDVRIVNIKVIGQEEKIFFFDVKDNNKIHFRDDFVDMLFSDNYYGIGIYSIPDLTLIKANERYTNAFDSPLNIKENCIGKKIQEFIPGFKGSSYERLWVEVLKSSKPIYIEEFMYDGFDRGITYWKLSLVPICDENKIKYCVVMSTEITEQVLHRKKVEEQSRIIEEQKKHLEKVLEAKDEFLSFISHEFRTPLNVISTAIQAMNSICGNELSEKAKKYLGMIKMNTLRQLRLVNNLLDITRADEGRIKIRKKNIDIVFLTKSIVESVLTYAAQKNIDISFICPFENKVVAIDDEKYERILLNLLSNAIKFSPENLPIVVKLFSKQNQIFIEVKDYGIGIPEEKKSVIFEKFGQVDSSLSRRAEGTGIGLSLVKRFVTALGGCISVKSRPRRGSTFIVQLPDETVIDDGNDNERVNLLDNRLIQSAKVEFSDIYLH